MTWQRFRVLLAGTLAIAVAIGGWVYSRSRGVLQDDTATKTEIPPPVSSTKPTAPSRKLNERERMLVGTWKFENTDPKLVSPGYHATYEFSSDGTYSFSFSSVYVEHWSRRGTFRVAGDLLIKETAGEEAILNLIEELSATRLVVSAQNGRDREVRSWSRQ